MELAILDFIQENLRCAWLDALMVGLTRLGDAGLIWLLLAAGLLLHRRTRRLGLAVALALLVEALLCNVLLKPLVARVRPCDVNAALELLIARPQDWSFPSGHTEAGFAAAGALYFAGARGWLSAGLLAAALGFSRLYLYVHWPSDVLCGAALGIFAAWLVSFALKKKNWL